MIKPMSTNSFSRRYPITYFVLVAFAFTWIWWFLAHYFGVLGDIMPPITAIGSFGPALAAMLVVRTGSSQDEPDAKSRHWRVLALLVFALGSIYLLRFFTGGRAVLRGEAPPSELSYGPIEISFAVLVVLIAAWAFGSAYSTDKGIRAYLRTTLQWKASIWLWVFALTILPIVYLLAAGLTMVAGGTLPTPAFFSYEGSGAIGLVIVAFLYGAVFGGGNEEIGWRGYMLPALQARYSPLTASLIIAVVWSVWHLPLHLWGFYDGTVAGQQSLLTAMIVMTIRWIPLTILLTWFFNRTGGNILLSVVIHATISISMLFVPFTSMVAVSGSLVTIGLILEGKMWKRRPDYQVTISPL
jgi:membrane protease YdiL (CAAX protease family)